MSALHMAVAQALLVTCPPPPPAPTAPFPMIHPVARCKLNRFASDTSSRSSASPRQEPLTITTIIHTPASARYLLGVFLPHKPALCTSNPPQLSRTVWSVSTALKYAVLSLTVAGLGQHQSRLSCTHVPARLNKYCISSSLKRLQHGIRLIHML